MTTRRTDSAAWTFQGMGDEFEEHAARHLPGYQDVQELAALIASFQVPDGGIVADLGASSGKTSREISRTLPNRSIRFYLYDSDASMLEIAKSRAENVTTILGTLSPDRPLCGLSHPPADLTIALWVLQFLKPEDRTPLLAAARARANDSSMILVGAKTRFPDPRLEEIAVAALDDYKAREGVDETERARKTKSLRGILRPETSGELCDRLTAAGWNNPSILWRWHVWTLIAAYASPNDEKEG